MPPQAIRTVPPKAWQVRNIPILKLLTEKIIDLLRQRVKRGILEDSHISYRNPWFLVQKKDGGLRLTNNATQFNAVTVQDAFMKYQYWWEGMYTDTSKATLAYEPCQKYDARRFEELVPTAPSWPCREVHIDVQYMPSDHGKGYLAEARYDLTGFVEAEAMTKNKSQAVARFLRRSIFKGWVALLDRALFCDRTSVRVSHGRTPFCLVYGYDPVLPLGVHNPIWRLIN